MKTLFALLVLLAAFVVEAQNSFMVTKVYQISNGVPILQSWSTNNYETNYTFSVVATNDFALNTFYTNGTSAVWISESFTLTSTITELAKVSAYLDQAATGTFEATILPVQKGSAIAAADIYQLHFFLQPGARFAISNLSVGSATAAVVPLSTQQVSAK